MCAHPVNQSDRDRLDDCGLPYIGEDVGCSNHAQHRQEVTPE